MNNQQQEHAIELLNLAEHALSHASLNSVGDVVEHTQDRRDHMRVQLIVFLKALGDRRLTAKGEQDDESATCAKSQVEPAGQPDQALCKFYNVTDWVGLVRELVDHVAQLQDSAKRNAKPWEDTFPPTLLPAYIERVNVANAAAKPQGEPAAIDWPEYHSEGMGCGLEDRGITDRYEACRHGFEEAVERCAELFANEGSLFRHPPEQAAPEAFDPCGWTDRQVLDFLGVALRNVDLVGAVYLSEIRQGFEYMRDKAISDRAEPTVDAVAINTSWMTDAELDAICQPGSGNKAKRRIEAINKARGEA